MKYVATVACACLTLALGGCRVPPEPPPPVAFAPVAKSPADVYKEAKGWSEAQPSESALRGPWWEIFDDPQLNELEQQLEVSNQDLQSAEARFRQARAMVHFKRASEFPTLSTTPSISSIRDSNNAPYAPSSIKATGDFVLPFDLTYEVDVWGQIRRQVASSREEAQAVAADLESARLILHSELAIDYFELRSADAQKHLLDQTVDSYRQALTLTTNRFDDGAAPRSDVALAKTQLESAIVADTDVTVQRAQFEHALAVLIGKPPASFALSETDAVLNPPTVPAGLPSGLLERRPDIAAGERRVAEANQQIGVARTAYFPVLSLAAAAGFEGDSVMDWLSWPSRFWAVGPAMAETLFDAGRRRAVSDVARASYDGSVSAYREAVLTAFQQVEDNLAALRILELEAQQQHEATAAAQDSLSIVTNRYREGADPYLQVLTAQTIALANERNDLDLARRRMDASVLLIKALGGGWTTSSLPRQSAMH